MGENNEGQCDTSGINRRSLLRGGAAATMAGGSLAALSGGVAAETEPIAEDFAVETFDTRAGDLLNTPSEEGLLKDASADVLSTTPTSRSRSEVGVARAYNDAGTEFFVAVRNK